MTATVFAGLGGIAAMVAYPAASAWCERLRSDRRRRVARIVAAAERDGRVAK